MKPERTLLDVLFPKVRAEILRLLFASPSQRRYVRELMRSSGVALSTVQDELRKLSAVGLLASYSDGYHRFYVANGGHPLASELRRIVEMSERLPRTKGSALVRSGALAVRRKRHQTKARPLPPNRGINWGLFSKRSKT